MKETGSGEGEGFTINIPVPREFLDEDFLCLYQSITGPVMDRFRPELILVCAGFDAHYSDPIGRSKMTEKGFQWLTRLLLNLWKEIHRPPILFVLEGGYDFRALTCCVKEVLGAMKAVDNQNALPEIVSQKAGAAAEKIRQIHAGYGVWAD